MTPPNVPQPPLVRVRTELNRWGHGDFHYGPQEQERSVVEAVAELDRITAVVKNIPCLMPVDSPKRGGDCGRCYVCKSVRPLAEVVA